MVPQFYTSSNNEHIATSLLGLTLFTCIYFITLINVDRKIGINKNNFMTKHRDNKNFIHIKSTIIFIIIFSYHLLECTCQLNLYYKQFSFWCIWQVVNILECNTIQHKAHLESILFMGLNIMMCKQKYHFKLGPQHVGLSILQLTWWLLIENKTLINPLQIQIQQNNIVQTCHEKTINIYMSLTSWITLKTNGV